MENVHCNDHDHDGSFQFYDDEDDYHCDEIEGDGFPEGKYVTMVMLFAMTMIKISMLIER